MDLGNLIETVVHYPIIEGITCFDCRDEFPIVNALVYVHDAYLVGLKMNYDIRLSIVMMHQATILHVLLSLREY